KMMKLIYKMWDNPIDNWNLVGLKNMGKSIEWKIHNKEVERSYYRAITDIELYVLAISCDLQYYFKINGNIDNENKLKYITKYVNYIFDSEIKYVDDKIWYFQADVWSEHPDYLYATYDEIKEHLKPIPVKNIVMDSSHYSRFPLWLVSFREIQDEEYRKKYSKLLDDLSHTFISKVLVVPTDDFKLYRTKNYMNGINGLFRYNYMNKGNNYAHKPYSLGTFYLGWWKFTDTKEIDNIYKSISKISFPMSLKYRNSYTTFDKNNYENFVKGSMVYPYVLNNGYAELISLLKYNNK
ncbi:MAG: hypothetical protein RR290_04540, partial [Clostridia bacterium]